MGFASDTGVRAPYLPSALCPLPSSPSQGDESFGGGGDRLRALGEAEAGELRRAGWVGVKGGGRDGGDANLGGEVATECRVVGEAEWRDVGEEEVAPADRQGCEAGVVQGGGEEVAPGGVFGMQGVVVAVGGGEFERHRHRLLERGRGGEGDELVDGAQGGVEGRRADCIADL